MDDTTILLLGPLLALLPILVWELAIKPSRTRRNLAMLLIAELELNLEEIAYFQICLEEDPDNHLVNLLLPRSSFVAAQILLAELPARDLRDLTRFYAITGKIDATQVGLTGTRARLERETSVDDRVMLAAATAAGTRALERRLAEAWTLGVEARASLDNVVRSSWMDEPPPIETVDTIMSSARLRRGPQQSAP